MPTILMFTLALTLGATPVPAAGPCDLLDLATVSELVGQPVKSGMAQGPTVDEETGGELHMCMYMAGRTALIVSVVTFKSAAAARSAMTKAFVEARLDGEAATITEEPGLGEKAYWAVVKNGVHLVVLRGSHALGLALGGSQTLSPAAVKAPLRAAAVKAIARM